MDPNSITQITSYLDKLGEKLGIGATMVWPWLIRQVYVECITAWLSFISSVTVAFLIGKFAAHHWNGSYSRRSAFNEPEENSNQYSIVDNDHEPIWIIGLIVIAIWIVLSFIFLMGFGFNFINPEYHALKDLMTLVNRVK